jgi:hypothetical protein
VETVKTAAAPNPDITGRQQGRIWSLIRCSKGSGIISRGGKVFRVNFGVEVPRVIRLLLSPVVIPGLSLMKMGLVLLA